MLKIRLKCQIIETLFLSINELPQRDDNKSDQKKKVGGIKTSAKLFSFPHTKAFPLFILQHNSVDVSSTGGCYLSWIRFCLLTRLYSLLQKQPHSRRLECKWESHTELLRMEWFIRLLASPFLFSATPLTPTPTPPHPIHRLYIYGKSTKMRSAHSHHHPHSACYQKENTRFFIIIQFSFFHAKKSQNFCVIFTCWKSRSWFHQFILCLSAVLSYKLFDIT